MLALAQALQVCTEVSVAKTGILCEAARELQQCMAPLMTLNGDDVVEASLLRPTGKELGPSPTPEEKTTLLGKEDGSSEKPRPTLRHSEIPRLVEPAEWVTAPVTSTAPTVALPGKERSYRRGLMLTLINLASGSKLTWRGIAGSKSGGRNSILLSALWTGVVMMPKLKVWLTGKLQASTCQPPQKEV